MSKRSRTSTTATATTLAAKQLQQGVAYPLLDVIRHEVMPTLVLPLLPMHYISVWHRTCRQLALDWSALPYVTKLVRSALEQTRALYTETLQSVYHGRLARFDTALLALAMVQYIVSTLLPRALDEINTLRANTSEYHYIDTTVHRMLCTVPDERIKELTASDTTIIPGKLINAFLIAHDYIEDRYGWDIGYNSPGQPDRMDSYLMLRRGSCKRRQ